MLDLSDYLTTSEVSKLSGKVRQTVCRAAQLGQLQPAAKLPGSLGTYLFQRVEVERWIANSPAPYRRWNGGE